MVRTSRSERVALVLHLQETREHIPLVYGERGQEVFRVRERHRDDRDHKGSGDREHAVFEFLQGNLRVQDYIDTFKFCDYQIIQMANLSPATFGYEKDAYQNVASINLNANLTEMTIEAIKRQLEPQVNHLIENIIKLQDLLGIEENRIPEDLEWDYGNNELIDDNKKITTLQAIQRTMSVPYSTRAKILAPIINKLIDEDIDADTIQNEYKEETKDIKVTYEEY